MTWNKEKIDWANIMNTRRIDSTIRLAKQYVGDPDKSRRLEVHLCKVCFYNSGRICGQAFTSYICGNCQEEKQHSNTCTPPLCPSCADDLNVCRNCGAMIDGPHSTAESTIITSYSYD